MFFIYISHKLPGGTESDQWVNLNDLAGGAFDDGTEVPEHVLKIYKTKDI